MCWRDEIKQFKLSEDVIRCFEWLLFMTYIHLFDFFFSTTVYKQQLN